MIWACDKDDRSEKQYKQNQDERDGKANMGRTLGKICEGK